MVGMVNKQVRRYIMVTYFCYIMTWKSIAKATNAAKVFLSYDPLTSPKYVAQVYFAFSNLHVLFCIIFQFEYIFKLEFQVE